MSDVRPESLLGTLRESVGSAHVHDGRVDTEVYSYDGSLALGTPDAVVFPADAAQTAAVTAAASRANVPCTPRGFGTNLSGGSIARRGGVVIGFSRMNRTLSIEPARRCARVQPGVTNLELQDALAPLGYFYAPDPASQKVATMGGNVAENSGGPHCVKYGVTTNHILGLQVVLPDGETVRLGGPALDPPGLDLRGLLVGSEGTLGLVTEVTIRILPRPEQVVTLLAIYDEVAQAARSVSDIIARGIVPATLEMMDAPVMRAVEESYPCGYPLDAGAVLIIEVEGLSAGLREQAEEIRRVCEANGCRSVREAKDDAERDQLWAGRRGAFGAVARLAPSFLVADCTVPRTRLPEALRTVATIADTYGFTHGNVFHAGDGNLHPLLFFDGQDPEQVDRVHEAGREVMAACVALGGTITGEHGVGVEKMDALRMVFSEDDLDFQRSVRAAFDPAGLLNPGKVIPDRAEGAQAPAPAAATTLGDELAPADASEAVDMVRAAFASPTALLPVGGGRRADFGNLSPSTPVPLSSRRLRGIVDYDPANLVVSVRAGTPLAALQDALAEHNQWLPLRPPLADGCTVGGMVALGACGPERLLHGAPRDRLLGLKFVDGRGRAIAAGGKVIKNVAGYDVTRLMAGSAGTLGFLTEVTFRVSLRPEVCVAVEAQGSQEACEAAATELLRSNLDPAFVWASAVDSAWQLTVGFEGFSNTVLAQTDGLKAIAEGAGLSVAQERNYAVCEGLHAVVCDPLYESEFLIRADLPLDSALRFAADALPGPGGYVDLGCGRVLAGLSALDGARWDELCRAAAEVDGHVILERAPAEFKQHHDVFGPTRPEWALMHRVKDAADPHGVFAPGRLPGRK